MASHNNLGRIKNIIGHIIFHSMIIYFALWITGFIIAYITGEMRSVGINNNAIYILLKWGGWLKNVWSNLPFDSYNHLKPKLLAAIFLPPIAVILYYIKNFEQIKEMEFFTSKKESIHGDAKWASEYDIKKAGLRAKEGIVLGKDGNGYLVADGYQHALIFAPTGSGKGAAIAIPNLLTWTQSVIVHDIKLENYNITSGWRAKQGDEVYVWDPANPDGITHCYNPLDWISHKPGQMVDDVQKIANLLTSGLGAGDQAFWYAEARSLFVGIVLYLLADNSKIRSFGEVTRVIRSDDVSYNLSVILDTLGKFLHPVAYMNLSAFLAKADKERSGVLSTLNSTLELWANPLLDTATATSDFNFQELKRKKTTIFVGVTPDNVQRLQKLMQVFYQQASEFLARKLPDLKEEPYGVLFLLDEFPTLGKMDQFKSGIAYFRGYRVRLMLITQDTQQLKGLYEDSGMNSFLSNSMYRITFSANNYETADLVSKLIGVKTIEQQSYNKPWFSLNIFSTTKSVSEGQRALLLAQEVIQLPRDEEILLVESFPPIKCRKNWYFKDKFYTSRLLPPTHIPKQIPYTTNNASAIEKL